MSNVRIEYRIGKTALQHWDTTVRKCGYKTLEPSKRRGKPPKEPMTSKEEKNTNVELERLQTENLRLSFMLNHKYPKAYIPKSKIRKVHYRSYKGEVSKIASNIINRNFTAEAPNRKRATDITQIKIDSAKFYLSPISDIFNGEIISYNISRQANMEQIYDMLDKAFARFDRLDGIILHSNQGWQYQHYGYKKHLKKHI